MPEDLKRTLQYLEQCSNEELHALVEQSLHHDRLPGRSMSAEEYHQRALQQAHAAEEYHRRALQQARAARERQEASPRHGADVGRELQRAPPGVDAGLEPGSLSSVKSASF